MAERVPPHPPEVDTLIAAARVMEEPPAASRGRLEARLQRLGASPTRWRRLRVPLATLSVAALFLLATRAWWSPHILQIVPKPVSQVLPTPQIAPKPAPHVLPTPQIAPKQVLPTPQIAPEPTTAPRTVVQHAETAEDLLTAELALLDPARAALARKDAATARQWLAQYRERFDSHGSLVEEYDALSIRVLVLSGDIANARQTLDRLAHEHPQSALLPSLQRELQQMDPDFGR